MLLQFLPVFLQMLILHLYPGDLTLLLLTLILQGMNGATELADPELVISFQFPPFCLLLMLKLIPLQLNAFQRPHMLHSFHIETALHLGNPIKKFLVIDSQCFQLRFQSKLLGYKLFDMLSFILCQ